MQRRLGKAGLYTSFRGDSAPSPGLVVRRGSVANRRIDLNSQLRLRLGCEGITVRATLGKER